MARGPIEFRWYDAFCPEDRWYTKDDFELERRVMVTTGFVLLQRHDYVVVAATYDEVADAFAQVIAIPKGCIISMRDVSELVEPTDDPSVADPLPSVYPAGRELP